MTDVIAAHSRPALVVPPPPQVSTAVIVLRVLAGALAIAVLVWAWRKAEMDPGQLVRDAGNMATLARDFFRPDFTEWEFYLSRIWESIAIAIWGTLLAVVVGTPFALLCSTNVVPVWISFPVRRLMDMTRAINELVFALIFIAAVGLGPFAGVLAIFVHTTGIIAKLFSEAVEAIDHGPVDGIRATGGTWLDEIIYGIIPQVLPLWVSYTLYRFESNVRSAAVIGIVGGGGIGMTFNEVMRGFRYDQAAAILLMVIAAVIVIDVASQQIRKRLI